MAVVISAVKLVDSLFNRSVGPQELQVIDALSPWLTIEGAAVAKVIAALQTFATILPFVGAVDFWAIRRQAKRVRQGLPAESGFMQDWRTAKFGSTTWLLFFLCMDLASRLSSGRLAGAEPLVIETLFPLFQLEAGLLSAIFSLALYGAILVPIFLTLDILEDRRARDKPQPRAVPGEAPPTGDV